MPDNNGAQCRRFLLGPLRWDTLQIPSGSAWPKRIQSRDSTQHQGIVCCEGHGHDGAIVLVSSYDLLRLRSRIQSYHPSVIFVFEYLVTYRTPVMLLIVVFIQLASVSKPFFAPIAKGVLILVMVFKHPRIPVKDQTPPAPVMFRILMLLELVWFMEIRAMATHVAYMMAP